MFTVVNMCNRAINSISKALSGSRYVDGAKTANYEFNYILGYTNYWTSEKEKLNIEERLKTYREVFGLKSQTYSGMNKLANNFKAIIGKYLEKVKYTMKGVYLKGKHLLSFNEKEPIIPEQCNNTKEDQLYNKQKSMVETSNMYNLKSKIGDFADSKSQVLVEETKNVILYDEEKQKSENDKGYYSEEEKEDLIVKVGSKEFEYLKSFNFNAVRDTVEKLLNKASLGDRMMKLSIKGYMSNYAGEEDLEKKLQELIIQQKNYVSELKGISEPNDHHCIKPSYVISKIIEYNNCDDSNLLLTGNYHDQSEAGVEAA